VNTVNRNQALAVVEARDGAGLDNLEATKESRSSLPSGSFHPGILTSSSSYPHQLALKSERIWLDVPAQPGATRICIVPMCDSTSPQRLPLP